MFNILDVNNELNESVTSTYSYLKDYLIGVLPPGYEWVYIYLILFFIIFVISCLTLLFSKRGNRL